MITALITDQPCCRLSPKGEIGGALLKLLNETDRCQRFAREC